MLQNAPPCACLPVGRGGDECSDFKNPIGRTFLSGSRIFAETGKVSAIRKAPPSGRGASLRVDTERRFPLRT
jgi:hypothetical protein